MSNGGQPISGVVDRFQLLVDAVEEYAIFILEPDGTVATWNSGAERIKGYSADEIIGKSFALFYSEEDVAAGKPAGELRHAAEHGECRDEGWRIRKDGSRFWANVVITAISDGRGVLTGYAKVTRDETARRMAENIARDARVAAEDANRDKDEFMSRMSHELRTPLNAILGFAQLMQLDGLRPDQHEHVEYILRASNHLLTLVDDVLDIARMATGGMRLSFEAVGVGEVVAEAIEMLPSFAARNNVEVVADATGLRAHVWADRQRLLQVTLNLLTNAVKYNVAGGSVYVRGSVTGDDRFRLTVDDTGRGISAADLERLFQPFERLAAQQTAVEGTGLGLTLTRELVVAMHGEVGMTSVLGAGSSFWVELPIRSAPQATADGTPRPLPDTAPTTTAETTVLYVEDDLLNIKLVERTLARRPGVTLLAAVTGRSGLELAVEQHPDLILLDLHLPDISGEEVLRLIRADPSIAGTPVVMLSADAFADRPARLLTQGANDFMTKPFDISRLLSLVDEITGAGIPAAPPEPALDDLPPSREGEARPTDGRQQHSPDIRTLHTFVHDMNNQLGLLLNYCALLRGETRDPAVASDLDRMHTATKCAAALTAALIPKSAGGAGAAID